MREPFHGNDDAWLTDLFRNSPDAILLHAPDGRILDANCAMQRLTGRPADELIGRRMAELLPPECQAGWEHDFDMLLKGQWNMLESRIQHAHNHHSTPVVVTMIARSLPGKQPPIILHFHDSSIYHTVEKALMASQAQWEMSFDAITACMCILDPDGRIMRINRAMNNRFNPAAGGELCNRHFSEVLRPASDRDGRELPHPVHDAPYVLEKTAFQGVAGWFNATAYAVQNHQKNVSGGILILHDITAQLQTEEALRKSQAVLRQSSKMEAIGRLAGGIAHDFNNMLTSVLGYSSMIIKNVPPDSPIRVEVEEIQHAAERATALTRQLLNFSHDRAIETLVMDLNSAIENLATFIRHTIGETIKLELHLAPDLYPVKADVCRLEQILVNLAINARDAMPDGGQFIIETSNFTATSQFCQAHSNIPPGEYALVNVSDTGQGMPPQVLEHIFEPFFTTKPHGKGTGLGLTTIYGIVKQFGGQIRCYSEVNKGTTFKICLPRAIGRKTPARAENAPADFAGGTETILVVDDEAYIVNLIRQILSKLGYTVLTTTSCREALAISAGRQDQIDLVLTDVIMPEMSGVELIERLQSQRPQTKAIFMSGYASNAAMQIGDLPPKIAFMQKPFSFDTLAKRVRVALDAK